MSILSFWLLRGEQIRESIRPRMIKSIYAFMFFSLLLTLLGLVSNVVGENKNGYVVPDTVKQAVSDLPKANSQDFNLLKDISIFDLRGWKPVSMDDVKSVKVSPANYINYLHLIKTVDTDKFIAHYSTSGYDIDLRCITHNYKAFVQTSGEVQHDGEKNYGIEIDVSNIPLNQEFLIVIEATYWNGFSNIVKETASTYTDKEVSNLTELGLIVLLPYDKPVKEVNKFYSEGGIMKEFREESKFYIDKNKRFIYWSLNKPRPDTHYEIDWTW